MKCPKCHALNAPKATECDGCGVVFAHVGRDQKAVHQQGPDLCSWNDHGKQCPCRAIVKIEGRRLCREHGDVSDNRPPQGRGNYAVKPARSHHMRQWDGWQYNPRTRRLEEREPGADLAELVPEEVGQA